MAAGKKRGASAPRPRSGYVREDQRHTVKVTLQLTPGAHELLLSLATEIGEGDPRRHLAETVWQALQALNREMEAEVLSDPSHPDYCDCTGFDNPHPRGIAGCDHDVSVPSPSSAHDETKK